MLGMYEKKLSHVRCRCFAAALSVVMLAACLMFQGTASAAENGSIGAGATILTGKVVTTVTRAVPVPFNAVVDEVLVKPGEAIAKGTVCYARRGHRGAAYFKSEQLTFYRDVFSSPRLLELVKTS